MSIHHGLRSAAGASVADPYFANTSLLLLGNGTNGGQNNSFVDGSSNAFSITRYGNTTQGTFSPFGYNWSNYFDGNGDYLNVPVSSALRFGTGDFTVEAWIYLTGDAAQDGGGNRTASICSCYPASTLTSAWAFIIFGDSSTTGTGLILGTANGGAASGDCTVTYSFSKNTWYHVAASRLSGTTRVYINGVSQSYTGSIGSTLDPAVIDPFLIGSSNNSAYRWYFPGYISNFRFVKGAAVYSGSSFTVPTAPITAITNTSLLTCQSNRFLDNSSNAFTITPYGDAKVTNFAPFPTNTEYSTGTNGGSGYFDGSSDYLTTPSDSAFAFGTGDYTMECWIYPLDQTYGRRLFQTGDDKDNIDLNLNGSGSISYYNGSTLASSSSGVVTQNAWNHVACVRSSGTVKIYVNGSSVLTQTTTPNTSSNRLIYIGGYTNVWFNGFISSLRILKGTAQYTANFTPSTTPLSSITNTSLLLNFTNGSIIDSTGKNDLETVGDAQISTSVKKYGTGSLKFDGTGDYLSIPDSSVFDLGSGDFTIETWVNFLALPSASDAWTFASQWKSSSPQSLGWFYYLFNNAGTYGIYLSYSTTGSNQINLGVNFSSAPSTGTWYHYAICRSGSNLRFFVDGTQIGSTQTLSATIFNSAAQVWIGAQDGGSAGYQLNGYLDDFRLTKYARYTAAFTPPSRQLPAR